MHEPLLSHPTKPETEDPASPMPMTKSRPVIFLAEDDRELRTLLADGLRRAGFHVRTASSGRDMLRLLTAASRRELDLPDALVMDVRMPRCSGIDVLGALRIASWKIPIVMITGFGEPALHARAAEQGATIVLDKPVALADLVAVVDMLLLFAAADTESAPTDTRHPSAKESS